MAMQQTNYTCPSCYDALIYEYYYQYYYCIRCMLVFPPMTSDTDSYALREIGKVKTFATTSGGIDVNNYWTVIHPPNQVVRLVHKVLGGERKDDLYISNYSIFKMNVDRHVFGTIEGMSVNIHYRDYTGRLLVADVGLWPAELENLLDIYASLNLNLNIISNEKNLAKQFGDFYIKSKKAGSANTSVVNTNVSGDYVTGKKVRNVSVDRRDQSVNLTDSVVNRSDIGARGDAYRGAEAPGSSPVQWDSTGGVEEQYAASAAARPRRMSICPYCGEKLDLPEQPRFCPYCEKRLVA
jgi:hypothetical protein